MNTAWIIGLVLWLALLAGLAALVVMCEEQPPEDEP